MDGELAQAITAYSEAHSQLRVLKPDETESLRQKVALRFGFAEHHIWWWESLPASTYSLAYSEGQGLEQLSMMLPTENEPAYLFVTDDDPPPWLCVSGFPQDLVEMLRQHRFFEYFIVDEGMTWIVFDTHHNTLISLRLPPLG